MATARRALVALILSLFAGTLLAGCTGGGPALPEQASCEEEHEVADGTTWLRILVARPLYANELGLNRLWAKPTAIGLLRNETGAQAFGEELPGERKDWTLDQSLWYEGRVPSGDYNFIRISVDGDIESRRTDGVEPEVIVRFGRLTITHPEPDHPIELPDGQCYTVLHEPVMTIQAQDRYEIADRA